MVCYNIQIKSKNDFTMFEVTSFSGNIWHGYVVMHMKCQCYSIVDVFGCLDGVTREQCMLLPILMHMMHQYQELSILFSSVLTRSNLHAEYIDFFMKTDCKLFKTVISVYTTNFDK
jgi:hypothetical protein